MNCCICEQPVMNIFHDAGCRRCGLPVDFSPSEPLTNATYTCSACGHTHNASSKIGREHKRFSRQLRQEARIAGGRIA